MSNMSKISVLYQGDLRTTCIHCESGDEIQTDAPKDNQGRGELFSPTDLFAASLGTCFVTIMGIAARSLHIDLKGLTLTIDKKMSTLPVRKIQTLTIEVNCPMQFSEDIQTHLEKAALNCPVKHSLHPDITLDITFNWGEKK